MLWSERGRAVIRRIPQEGTLTESDGSFVKVGTKTVVPADIQLVEEGLAKIWQMNPSAVRSVIADNFRRLTKPLAEPRNN
jgi:TatD DNase family protein